MTLFPMGFLQAMIAVGLLLAAGATVVLLVALVKDLKGRKIW
jgi:hypothetical protein